MPKGEVVGRAPEALGSGQGINTPQNQRTQEGHRGPHIDNI